MHTNVKNELAEVEKSEVAALALITLSPEKYTAEVYAPFKEQLTSAIDSVRTVEYDITTTAGMAVAVKSRALFRDLRVDADKERESRKKPIIKIGKLLESAFNEVEERIRPLELLFDADIKAEEDRKEAVKQAKIIAERERMSAHEALILDIQAVPLSYVGSTAADLAVALQNHSADPTLGRDFEEYKDKAQAAQLDTFQRLTDMHNKAFETERAAAEAKAVAEAEAARIVAERAELAKLREEAAERDRLAKIETDRVAAEQAAEARRLTEIAATQQAEADRVRVQAEANLKAERAALDERMRLEREAAAEQQARANAEIAAAQARLNEQIAAHAAKLAGEQRDVAHAEALVIDAQISAERQAANESINIEIIADINAERERLQCCADQHQVDAHAQPALTLMADAFDDSPTDTEIIYLLVQEYSFTVRDAIDRLAAIDFATARADLELAA